MTILAISNQLDSWILIILFCNHYQIFLSFKIQIYQNHKVITRKMLLFYSKINLRLFQILIMFPKILYTKSLKQSSFICLWTCKK